MILDDFQGGKLFENLILFGRLCRGLGMHVAPNTMLDVVEALALVDLGRRDDVYHAMRALMVLRQRDLAIFDQAFTVFWQPPAMNPITLEARVFSRNLNQRSMQFLLPPNADPDDPNEPNTDPIDPNLRAVQPTYSQRDILRHKDFAEMTGEELSAVQRMIEVLPWSLGERRSRRYVAGNGRQIDMRRLLRRYVRSGAEAPVLPRRESKIKPRPLVLLCDISGSMERYTRILMHFTHTLAHTMYQVESFVFAARLTHITRAVRSKSIDAALREVGRSVNDWGGGTRTGDALRTFNFRWARRVLGHGAVVLLITDGWDRGDPDVLREEAARLQRNCYRFVWLNPLLTAPGYEPLTRGAQALLPYVDDFLPVANLASLEMLAYKLRHIDWSRRERRPVRLERSHV